MGAIVHGQNLWALIADAFDLPEWQLAGGEKWVDALRFDITAGRPRNFSTMGVFQLRHTGKMGLSILRALFIDLTCSPRPMS